MDRQADIVIVGTGAAGLFCALKLPEQYRVLLITKEEADQSDSFLAQGGMCMLRGEEDYAGYFEDTMRAGHYENDRTSVEIMIRSSGKVARELMAYGVAFAREKGKLAFTREGGHSRPRILFHEDVTGKEITGTLLERAQERANITILTHTRMLDILEQDAACCGLVIQEADGTLGTVQAPAVVLACGGLGGLYQHSTNFRHITGDALAVAMRHGIALEHMDYIQIHPTTLYSEKPGRRFLISESVRGEGAILLNREGKRFTDELQPRDVVTAAIRKQMEIDHMPYVRLSLERIPEEEIRSHFPNIYQRCLKEGYDVTREPVPVVPAQHYFMGGIKVDHVSRTSMPALYAVGETSCNGVHGANRLASNSLLESMVFAERAAMDIVRRGLCEDTPQMPVQVEMSGYYDIEKRRTEDRNMILQEIEREKKSHE